MEGLITNQVTMACTCFAYRDQMCSVNAAVNYSLIYIDHWIIRAVSRIRLTVSRRRTCAVSAATAILLHPSTPAANC